MHSDGEMFFFMKWVAIRAMAAKLVELGDISNTIAFMHVLASGDLTPE